MQIRHIFIPIFLLFLLIISRFSWSAIDNETASVVFAEQSSGLFATKPFVVFATGALVPFLWFLGNPAKSLGYLPVSIYFFALASVTWSFDTSTTLFSSMMLLMVFCYPFLAVKLLGPRLATLLFWMVGVIVIIASIALAAVGDTHALMGSNHFFSWRGLFGHKNVFGPFLATNIIISVFAWRIMGVPRIICWSVAILDAFALSMSRSTTPIIGLAIGLSASLVFIPIVSRQMRYIWIACTLSVTALGAFLFVTNIEATFEFFGRDPTMTNRTLLWGQVFDLTYQHRLGTGFGTGGGSQVSIEAQKLFRRKDSIGIQSGYLTGILELGWAIIALYVAWILAIVGKLLTSDRVRQGQQMVVATLVFHSLYSVSESAGLIQPSWSLSVCMLALSVCFRPDTQQSDTTEL
ncbi:hypothetical protein [Sphingomonas sp. VNH70]|uniref:O-antigen ligase family protein n=1 Tax=Sphingomonas silueang TaxID=3156617 RepID=UPI0032B49595